MHLARAMVPTHRVNSINIGFQVPVITKNTISSLFDQDDLMDMLNFL
jgi:hypothetical protein